MFARMKEWARALKREIAALWFAARDPRTPKAAKWLAFGLVCYALSPIDLIPDFVPVLGYLDDLVLLPLGAAIVVRLMPPVLMSECRERAAQAGRLPASRAGLFAIFGIWLLAAIFIGAWIFRHWL